MSLNQGNTPPGMDAETKSTLTTIAASAAPLITTWLIAHGVVPGVDADSATNIIANLIVGVIGYGLWFALLLYKRWQHTPTAQITAVRDADNGVKVVPLTSPTPAVDAPIPSLMKSVK